MYINKWKHKYVFQNYKPELFHYGISQNLFYKLTHVKVRNVFHSRISVENVE